MPVTGVQGVQEQPPLRATRPGVGAVLPVPDALALGFVVVAVVDVVITLAKVGLGAPGVRAVHLAYIVGYRAFLALAFALVIAAIVPATASWFPRLGRAVAALLLAAASIMVGSVVLADDLYSFSPFWRVVWDVLLSLTPLGLGAVRWLAGRIVARLAPAPRRGVAELALARLPFAIVGVVAAVANQLVLPQGYRGMHLGLLVMAGVATGMALVGLELRETWGSRWWRARRAATVALAAWALWSVLDRPSSHVSSELARDASPGLYDFLAPLGPDNGPGDLTVSPTWLARYAGDPRWFEPHDDAPARPPGLRLIDPERVIVLLVTVDSLRRDVFTAPQHASVLPTLQRLRAESSVFTWAYTSAPSTTPSIASIFTGRYLSELYWTAMTHARTRVRYHPIDDPSPRIPELLPPTVRTLSLPSNERVRQVYGAVRGMREETPREVPRYLMADELLPVLLDWLRREPERPAFAHVHLMDGHEPYTRGGEEGTIVERYLRSLTQADADLGALVAALRRAGLWSRTVLILSADHGEAFGEHGYMYHGATLYEEVTRVPMLIRVPGQRARVVEQVVSTIDLTPTILDLFQRPSPGNMKGQSLLPLVAGRDARFDRPIALESARLHRAIVFRDKVKVIWRSREGQYELYDLRRDPGELDNRIDIDPSAPLRMAAVRAFFLAHEHVRPGYRTPHYWP